jgi:hypothetical protein
MTDILERLRSEGWKIAPRDPDAWDFVLCDVPPAELMDTAIASGICVIHNGTYARLIPLTERARLALRRVRAGITNVIEGGKGWK